MDIFWNYGTLSGGKRGCLRGCVFTRREIFPHLQGIVAVGIVILDKVLFYEAETPIELSRPDVLGPDFKLYATDPPALHPVR
ncbi:hypothetical protein AKJ52_02800 [candidate division MSBL1 archaeon SCGC-AAA382C18]|uniref:Uncharacterized protein n=1 Tax=candidate division MSBL1 archaeon SCGC-AAA382C18 TaxID=1698281 RepID=A0A133VHL4_9EURY|nr:hypothetical protein AKJ52_02800 [candidate division MSBL1 archaeon SCGC-AAA382C18]